MTQLDEKLRQIDSESLRGGRLARRTVGRVLLGGIFKVASLRRR